MSDNFEILAIDDDQAFISDLKAYFMPQGIRVATLSDPVLSSALDFGKFKIVLLDIDMPGLSGREVLDMMPASCRPVVIIVSGHSDVDTRIDLLGRGADLFLPKPLDLTEALFICRRILGRHQTRRDVSNYWSLSRSKHTICSPEGAVFGLTTSEFRILELLLGASPNVVTKETLAKAIAPQQDTSAFAFYRSLEVMISRMRRRFSGSEMSLPIKALRNVGYVFHGQSILTD